MERLCACVCDYELYYFLETMHWRPIDILSHAKHSIVGAICWWCFTDASITIERLFDTHKKKERTEINKHTHTLSRYQYMYCVLHSHTQHVRIEICEYAWWESNELRFYSILLHVQYMVCVRALYVYGIYPIIVNHVTCVRIPRTYIYTEER